MKTYSEMMKYDTYEDRLRYLITNSKVGEDTFGYDRYLNQMFYKSAEWKHIRDDVILRDNGCDLGIEGMNLSKVLIHHMNPISKFDILNRTDLLMNPEYLVCVSHDTHNAIHYGDVETVANKYGVIRTEGDTKLW